MNENLLQLIKKEIEIKVGKKILTGKDCTQLSDIIYNDTKLKISVTTLKRFFGVIKSDFNFSKFTIESLVQYIGYQSLDDFRELYNEAKKDSPSENSWELLKNRVNIITEKSLKSMKLHTGYEADKNIFREFAKEKFEHFTDSDKTATLFSSPAGFGKTTLLIQIVENYFTNKYAEYKDDIIILIDGKLFLNLYAHNPENDFLSQFLHFKLLSSWAFYFFKNPEQRKGRIWVFIDDVDDIFFDTESYLLLLENLMRMIMAFNYGWYKVVLTCRPENLDFFNHLADKYPQIQDVWFESNFNNMNENQNPINIPILSEQEINHILKMNEIKYDYSYFYDKNSEIAELINQPRFLSLFIAEYKQSGNLSVIVLLMNFLQKWFFSSPYKNEKLKIINRFIELCNRGKYTDSVKKDELLAKSQTPGAYRELLSLGILYENFHPNELLNENTWVRFGNFIIFDFFLLEKWRQGREMNIELYNLIRRYYKENVPLQKNMVKLFFSFLEYQNKHELIKKLRLVSALGRVE